MSRFFTTLSLGLLFLVFLIACNSNSKEASVQNESELDSTLVGNETIEISEADSKKDNFDTDELTQSAQKWLVSTIENYFHPMDGEHTDISSFSTDEYTEFKQDAMNLNNPSFSEEEFREKWKHKNLDLIGMQNGFMISAQDYHTIKVTEAKLKDKINEETWLFEVVVEDLEYKGKYWREVVVSKAGNSFLIEDVMEIKEEHPQ